MAYSTHTMGFGLQSHAIGNRPEWELVGRTERNLWQEIAAATGGVVAPGMILTATGFGLSVDVNRRLLREYQQTGRHSGRTLLCATAALLGEGVLDLLDGSVATATGTRSPLGRRADTGSDVCRIGLTTFTLAYCKVVPPHAATILAVQKIVTGAPSVIANARGNEPAVSSYGKVTAALQRVCLGAYLLSATCEQLGIETVGDPAKAARYATAAETLYGLATTALVTSSATSIPAALTYARAAKS